MQVLGFRGRRGFEVRLFERFFGYLPTNLMKLGEFLAWSRENWDEKSRIVLC